MSDRPPNAPMTGTTRKRKVRDRIPGQDDPDRTQRDSNMIDQATWRIIRTRHEVTAQLQEANHRLAAILFDPDAAQERANLEIRILRLNKLRIKLDNDYTHWDDIDTHGYDKNDPDDDNYPPPTPPPPYVSIYADRK
jgi:hypothetical protein